MAKKYISEKKHLVLGLLLFVGSVLHAQVSPTAGQNYIIKRTPREATTTVVDLLKLPAAKQRATIEYYDGLGRPLQTIGVAATPNADGSAFNDQITPHVYDGMGREYRQYLPLPKAQGAGAGAYLGTALNDQTTFYNVQFNNQPGYGETVFDGSPLNRVVEQSAPGTSYALGSGHTVSTAYGTNKADEVVLWTVADNGTLTGGQCYLPGTLYRTAVQDEDKTTTVEYKDLEGHVVRKVADADGLNATTDYVYDDFGRLRWVLPPKYMASLDTKGLPKGIPAGTSVVQGAQELNSPSSTAYLLVSGASLTLKPGFVGQAGFSAAPGVAMESLDALAYYYEYDGYGRMIKKKLPGVEAVYMVYDGRDRLVAVQDGNLRVAKDANSSITPKWLYTRYDALNRPVETGYLTNGVATQAAMQQLVDAAFSASPQYDTPSGVEYSKSSFPRVDSGNKALDGTLDALTYTFYDSYDNGGGSKLGGSMVYDQVVATNVTGLSTVSRVRELTTSTWSTTTTYYDEKGRVIQTIKKELYGGKAGDGITVSSKLNFVGQPDEVKEEQTFNGNNTTLVRTYKYYDSGLLKGLYVKLNSGTEETVATYTYDALGHVLQKKYGGTDQKQHYEYNIRGWLTKINEPNTAGDDFFAMSLAYEAPEVAGANVKPLFGGNISSMVWRTKMVDGSQNKKGYGFAYDRLDRLTGSSYATTEALTASDAYAEKSLGYDVNGNITNLTRTNGASTATIYGYAYSGNRLLSINGGAAYQYDANGNATTDGRNGFAIQYNEMNLPKSVSKGGQSVGYTYDATGVKLAVANPDGSARYYHGSMVYDQRKTLAYALHEEGMVLGNGTYQYNLKDHLGNTRAMFSKAAGAGQTLALAQATDYYPFGKSFEDIVNSDRNRYLYNGKELQDQSIGGTTFGWYDYGARFYDPELGRWHSVDPKSEKFFSISTYAYCHNDPLSMIDPDGMADIKFQKKKDEQYVSQQSKNVINKSADNLGVKTVTVSSTYRDPKSQINAMYSNCEKTGSEYQIKEVYGKKGDAVCATYQKAKDGGMSPKDIKTEMLKTAEKVGFVSTHSSSNYSKLNAIDMPMTGVAAKLFSNELKDNQSSIVTRLENGVVHAEIPTSQSSQQTPVILPVTGPVYKIENNLPK
ncbi:DUF6443 domain-containing protein [uncultured Acetobacteroides sp.]|uniref:RHS repeat domain-containing protein n=1 Tax=uncultured Acetobacteroides sp. TaxID=1760811 RepID=UPI0029F570A4|nr:DUF6443 domain-containing protein [uncultured Acetobacteroides sp.]